MAPAFTRDSAAAAARTDAELEKLLSAYMSEVVASITRNKDIVSPLAARRDELLAGITDHGQREIHRELLEIVDVAKGALVQVADDITIASSKFGIQLSVATSTSASRMAVAPPTSAKPKVTPVDIPSSSTTSVIKPPPSTPSKSKKVAAVGVVMPKEATAPVAVAKAKVIKVLKLAQESAPTEAVTDAAADALPLKVKKAKSVLSASSAVSSAKPKARKIRVLSLATPTVPEGPPMQHVVVDAPVEELTAAMKSSRLSSPPTDVSLEVGSDLQVRPIRAASPEVPVAQVSSVLERLPLFKTRKATASASVSAKAKGKAKDTTLVSAKAARWARLAPALLKWIGSEVESYLPNAAELTALLTSSNYKSAPAAELLVFAKTNGEDALFELLEGDGDSAHPLAPSLIELLSEIEYP